eukprot:9400714-Karenia_brevis.AAC.1
MMMGGPPPFVAVAPTPNGVGLHSVWGRGARAVLTEPIRLRTPRGAYLLYGSAPLQQTIHKKVVMVM